MQPFESHQILVGDCLDLLRQMPSSSVHCCVTSPPYFGLRDYGVNGQIGLEESPNEFIARLVEVFREVHRVLRDDGTLWLNLGDSYAGSWGAQGHGPSNTSAMARHAVNNHPKRTQQNGTIRQAGVKPKDLYGIPWRVAFALQADGWYLRQDIIWNKPNPMPESVRDRCTKAHEYLFLLSKSPRYHFDHEAMKEPAAPSSIARWQQDIDAQAGSDRVPGKSNGAMKAVGGPRPKRDSFQRENSKREQVIPGQNKGTHRPDRGESTYDTATRNKRSVWTVATRGFTGAHFATFPPDLIRPCILAGCPPDGVVLDPFGGAGTTGLVAMQEGRRSIMCELNPDYAELASARLQSAWLEGAAQLDAFAAM